MCGIAGIVRPEGLAPDDEQAVLRMTEAQRHRGPSGSGFHCDRHAALGHRRLSVIDVSIAGRQPMTNEDGSIWLTYNGEIYNHQELRRELVAAGHRFVSNSDTEVLIHGYEEWGSDGLLARARGMFAFGLWDTRRGQLLLTRDRLGIKPLYYWTDGRTGALAFASEVRALLAGGFLPDACDRSAVAGFLLTGAVPSPRTIVEGVSSLPPGHALEWRSGRTAVRQYWDLPVSTQGTSDVSRVGALLEDSVARHLVSDVPLGVFLSGGVDSGAVVALASRARGADARPLTTLTVVFDEEAFSEAAETRALAARFGTDHREVRVTRSAFVDEIPNILAAMDQPTNDGVNTYFVSKAARESGLTVVLSGLGGDEVFWGYKHYRTMEGRAARWLARSPSPLRSVAARAVARWGAVAGQDRLMRASFLERSATSRDMYLLLRGFFPPAHVQRLLGITRAELDAEVDRHFAGIGGEPASVTGARGLNRVEFKRYLHDQLLRDSDVFSMAHSIELRVPLLDDPIVACAATLAPGVMLRGGSNKPVLVDAVDDPLVRHAAAAPKRGFSFPMAPWMRASAPQLEDMALSAQVFERREVQRLWNAFRGGRLHWSRAWALTVLGGMMSRRGALRQPADAPHLRSALALSH